MSAVEVMPPSIPSGSSPAAPSSRRNSLQSTSSSSRKSSSNSRSPPPPSIILDGSLRRKSLSAESIRPTLSALASTPKVVGNRPDGQEISVSAAASVLSRLRQQRRASLDLTAAPKVPSAPRPSRNSLPGTSTTSVPAMRGRQMSVSRPLPAARAAQLQLLAEQARLAAVGSSNLRTARAMSSAMTDAVRKAVNEEVTRRRTASMSAAISSSSSGSGRKRSFVMMALGDHAAKTAGSSTDDGSHDSAIMSDDDDDDNDESSDVIGTPFMRRPSSAVAGRSGSISQAAALAREAHAAEWVAATTSHSFLQAAGEVAHDYASFYRFERQWADRALHYSMENQPSNYSMEFQPRRPSTVQEGSEEGRSESDGRSVGGSRRESLAGSLTGHRDKRPRMVDPLTRDPQVSRPVTDGAADKDDDAMMPPPPRGDSASPTCSPTSSPKPTRASLTRRKSSSANQDVDVLHMGPSSRGSVSSDWRHPLGLRLGAMRSGSISASSGHGSFSSGHGTSFSSRGAGSSFSSISSGGQRKSSFGLERVLSDFASLLAGREEVCTGLEQLAKQARALDEHTASMSASGWTEKATASTPVAKESEDKAGAAVADGMDVDESTPVAPKMALPNGTSPETDAQAASPTSIDNDQQQRGDNIATNGSKPSTVDDAANADDATKADDAAKAGDAVKAEDTAKVQV